MAVRRVALAVALGTTLLLGAVLALQPEQFAAAQGNGCWPVWLLAPAPAAPTAPLLLIRRVLSLVVTMTE